MPAFTINADTTFWRVAQRGYARARYGNTRRYDLT